MAVGFDAFTSIAITTATLTATHTPVGTPKSVLIYVVGNSSNANGLGTVDYGGTTVPIVGSSPVINAGEGGNVYSYFLGSGIPAGAQTVTINTAAVGASSKFAGIITLTALQNTTINSIKTLSSNTITSPMLTLTLSGSASFCSIGFWSGLNAVGDTSPPNSWTNRVENDFGNQIGGIYTYNTIGTVDVNSAGYVSTGGDDAAMMAISITELPAPAGAAVNEVSDFMFAMS